MLEAASCSRRQGRGKETGSVASSQAVGRGSAGSKGGAGGRAGIEPGLELGFLCFPPCCRGCPFPSPSYMGADVLFVSALAAPSAHPSRAPAQPEPRPLLLFFLLLLPPAWPRVTGDGDGIIRPLGLPPL